MRSYRFSTAACLALFSSTSSSSQSNALTSSSSFIPASRAKLLAKVNGANGVLLFSSRGDNNDYNSNDEGVRRQQQQQFRMVKQFNGDFKAVPYDEYEGQGQNNPAAESEMQRIEQMYRRQPPLTSPARALLDKQWDWERPSDHRPPRPRVRQVRTFSGMMKTVPEDEYDPAFDHRVTNSQFGRVDGTGYVPDLSPRDRMWIPPPPPPPPQRMQPPPPPPMYTRQETEGVSPSRRREMERFRTKLVGEEFRREMRKYRQDDFGLPPPPPEYDYYEEDRYQNKKKQGPLSSLAKSTEKFLQQITGIGRSSSSSRKSYQPPSPPRTKYRMAPPDTRQSNFGWYRNTGANNNRPADEFGRLSGSFNSSPAVRSFEQQDVLLPPPPSYYGGRRSSNTYYERDRTPSQSASRAYQSFSDPNQRRRPQSNSYGDDQRPRYRMERQFSGEYISVPVHDNYSDNFYNNPAANSEVRRVW